MKLFAVVPALLVLISLCGSPVPPPPGSVSGTVFYDTNLNGLHDACDRPLASAQVSVVDAKGKTETVSTGPGGEFSVADVAAGDATVSLGGSPTTIWPSTTADERGVTVAVPSGKEAGGVLIGAASLRALSRSGVSVIGVVFNDRNGDGQVGRDECGIPQSRVEWMLPPESNPNQSASGQSSGPDPNGDFVFSGLDSVPHLTINVVPGNWIPAGSEADPCSGWPGVVPDQRPDGVYEARIPLQPARRDDAVSGTVFDDANSNGVRDIGEQGISGVEVAADPVDNDCFGDYPSVLAGPEGRFKIPGLGPVTYRLYVTPPRGQQPTNQLIDQGIVSPPLVDLSIGPASVDVPVRVTQAAVVHIRVFSDANNNGVRDPTEDDAAAGVCLYPPSGEYSNFAGNGAIQGGYQGCTGTGIADDPAIGPLREGHYAVQVTIDGGPTPVYGPSFVDITNTDDVTLEIGIVPSALP